MPFEPPVVGEGALGADGDIEGPAADGAGDATVGDVAGDVTWDGGVVLAEAAAGAVAVD